MKNVASVAAAFLLLSGLAVAGGDAKRETKLLEGTWKVTAAEVSGENVGLEKLGVDQILFKGDRVVLKNRGKDVAAFVYTVDPGRKPKEVTLLKEQEKQSLPCIYAVDGDELKWCMPLPVATKKVRLQRPESFATKDRPVMLLTARREKR
jgi:uncharacterized protein (TIGR03067 family)